MFDFNSATKITGSKYLFLKNQAAILELALINWSIQYVIKKGNLIFLLGYNLLIGPDICKNTIIEGCGFSPRDDACNNNLN